jgi:peptidoglycan hydrolase CwlO-like protein
VTISTATSARRIALVILGLVVLLASAPPAGAQSDPAAKRRKLQQERAQKAAEVNALKASDAELERALDAIDGNLRSQEAAATAARQAADAASQQAIAARAEQQRAAAALAKVKDAMRQVAVDAYVRGPQGAAVTMAGDSLSDTVLREHLLETAVGRTTDLADQLEALGQDLAMKRKAAEDAVSRALARKRQMDAELNQLASARLAKQRLADGVESRLERALAEADGLAAVDRQLAAQIRANQTALARRAGPSSSRGGGSRPTSNPNLRTVRGITVAASIADNLEALLNASDGAGLNLGGSGWRSSEGQVQTRRQNCGTSDYDVYEKPASQCSPPTARPGQSMHEQGLAVDFTNNGSLITSRSNPAFQWLSANASRFGFYNLPSEPWHWSTNGN